MSFGRVEALGLFASVSVVAAQPTWPLGLPKQVVGVGPSEIDSQVRIHGSSGAFESG